jgi:hypothetical protein
MLLWKKMALGLGVILLLFVSFTQWQAYQKRQEIVRVEEEKVRKALSLATASAKMMLGLDSEKSSQTFAELFKETDERIGDLREQALTIQTASVGRELKEAAFDYVTAIVTSLRANSYRYRKSMLSGTALKIATDAVEDLHQEVNRYDPYGYGSYGVNLASARSTRTLTDAKEAVSEQKDADASYIASLSALRAKILKSSGSLKDFDILPTTFLDSTLKNTSANASQTIPLTPASKVEPTKSKVVAHRADPASPVVESDEGAEEEAADEKAPRDSGDSYNAAALRLETSE